jgi:hypothetical protein
MYVRYAYLSTKRHALLYDLHNTGELLSRQLVDVLTAADHVTTSTRSSSSKVVEPSKSAHSSQ